MDKRALVASVFEAAANRIVYKSGTPEFEPGAWRKVTDSLLLLLHEKNTPPFSTEYTDDKNPSQESFIIDLSPSYQEVLIPNLYMMEFPRLTLQVTSRLIETERFPRTPESLLFHTIYKGTHANLNDLSDKGGVAFTLWCNYFYGMCKNIGLPYEKIAGECNRVIRAVQDKTDWVYVDVNKIFYKTSNIEIFGVADYHSYTEKITNAIFLAKRKFIYTDEKGVFVSKGFKEYKNSY